MSTGSSSPGRRDAADPTPRAAVGVLRCPVCACAAMTGAREFTLNVLQFRSPMSAAINSVQTRTMLQHFPIRCGQPDIEFTVQFARRQEKTVFQAFVREHQVKALQATMVSSRGSSCGGRSATSPTGAATSVPSRSPSGDSTTHRV